MWLGPRGLQGEGVGRKGRGLQQAPFGLVPVSGGAGGACLAFWVGLPLSLKGAASPAPLSEARLEAGWAVSPLPQMRCTEWTSGASPQKLSQRRPGSARGSARGRCFEGQTREPSLVCGPVCLTRSPKAERLFAALETSPSTLMARRDSGGRGLPSEWPSSAVPSAWNGCCWGLLCRLAWGWQSPGRGLLGEGSLGSEADRQIPPPSPMHKPLGCEHGCSSLGLQPLQHEASGARLLTAEGFPLGPGARPHCPISCPALVLLAECRGGREGRAGLEASTGPVGSMDVNRMGSWLAWHFSSPTCQCVGAAFRGGGGGLRGGHLTGAPGVAG